MALTAAERTLLVSACRDLPPPKGDYAIHDYVTNLLLTVVDYQQHTTTVERARAYYEQHQWDAIRTFDDLKRFLAKYPNDQDGNTAAAQALVGYRFWTRVSQLRALLTYFEAREVVTQEALKHWARTSEYDRDFEGQVKGLGQAIYNWLVMRQGVETVKPDVRVRTFVESALGRKTPDISDKQLVELLKSVAQDLGVSPIQLDWSIWEHQGA